MNKLSLFLAVSLATTGFCGITVVKPSAEQVRRDVITGYGHGKTRDQARADAEQDAGRKLSLKRVKKYVIKDIRYSGGTNSAQFACYVSYNVEY